MRSASDIFLFFPSYIFITFLRGENEDMSMGRSRDVIGGVVDIFGRGIEPSVFADMKNAVGDIAGNGNIRWKANLYCPVGFLVGGREERLCEYGEEGKWDFDDNEMSKDTATIIMRLSFPNPDRLLVPNSYVTPYPHSM